MVLFPKKTLWLFLLVLPFTVISQTANVRTLTIEEVVQLGLTNSKQLQVSAAKLVAAQAKTLQSRDATIPSIGYTGSYTRLSTNVQPFVFHTPSGSDLVLNPIIPNNYVNRLSLSEYVFTGFRALNTVKANVFLENAVHFDAEKDKKDVLLNLLNAAVNLYKLQEARRVFEGSLATARNRQTDVRNLKTQGLALDNDVLKAELAVAQIEMARTETDNAILSAQYGLNVLMGLPEATQIAIDGTSIFKDSPVRDGLDAFTGNAGNRADVQAAAQRALAAEKQVDITKGSRWPLVSVGANLYENRPNQRLFPPEDKFLGTWDAGITLSWSLSNLYTSRHNVQEARANMLQNNLIHDQLTESARIDIANNYYSWLSAEQRIAVAEKSVSQAIENQHITDLRSNQQISSTTDLLEADALLLQAQVNQISARADARLSYFRLLKSAGKL
jgi:outer membrane protein TolC